MAELPPSEVKGVWFVAARDYALDVHGQDVLEQLIELSPAKYRDVYRAPIASAWYPEEALQEALSMMHEIVARDSDLMFEQIIEGCTEQGVHRLFQMLLRVSSPGFVLRMVPTMWRQIRRGAGHVDVVQRDGHSELHYSEFPWFGDRLYRLLTIGSLRAIVRLCTHRAPRIELLDHTHDRLSVRVLYRAQEQYPPPVRHTSTRPLPAALRPEAEEFSGVIQKDASLRTPARSGYAPKTEAKQKRSAR